MLRDLFLRILSRWNLPGSLFAGREYLYWRHATVFPGRNRGLLKAHSKVKLHDAFFNVWDEIHIEEGAVLGHQVMFLTGRHSIGSEGVERQPMSGGKIHVCQGAWIGSRAVVLGGIRIGKGSVIGAGAVVTKSVPDGEFWAGNPAKRIRKSGEPKPEVPGMGSAG